MAFVSPILSLLQSAAAPATSISFGGEVPPAAGTLSPDRPAESPFLAALNARLPEPGIEGASTPAFQNLSRRPAVATPAATGIERLLSEEIGSPQARERLQGALQDVGPLSAQIEATLATAPAQAQPAEVTLGLSEDIPDQAAGSGPEGETPTELPEAVPAAPLPVAAPDDTAPPVAGAAAEGSRIVAQQPANTDLPAQQGRSETPAAVRETGLPTEATAERPRFAVAERVRAAPTDGSDAGQTADMAREPMAARTVPASLHTDRAMAAATAPTPAVVVFTAAPVNNAPAIAASDDGAASPPGETRSAGLAEPRPAATATASEEAVALPRNEAAPTAAATAERASIDTVVPSAARVAAEPAAQTEPPLRFSAQDRPGGEVVRVLDTSNYAAPRVFQSALASDSSTGQRSGGEATMKPDLAPQNPAPAPAAASASPAKPSLESFAGINHNSPLAGPSGHGTAANAPASADAAAQQPQGSPHSPASQLGLSIAKAAVGGQQRFTIRLDPPELGRVEVRLDLTSDGSVRAMIRADSYDTLDLLQRDARVLERALSDAGLKTDSTSLNFSLNHNGAGGQGTGQTTAHDDPMEDGTEPFDSEVETGVEETADDEILLGGTLSDGLDIKV